MLETLRKDNADAQNVNADGDRKVVGSDAIGSCTKFDNFFFDERPKTQQPPTGGQISEYVHVSTRERIWSFLRGAAEMA